MQSHHLTGPKVDRPVELKNGAYKRLFVDVPSGQV